MQTKKNEKYDLERKRPLFFGVGLILSLTLIISAFEWRTEIEPICIFCVEEEIEEWSHIELTPVTKQEKLEPPKPKPNKKLIQTVDAVDELKEVAKEIEIEIDNEFNEESVDTFEGPTLEEELTDEPFIFLEEMPEFPGGETGIYQFIKKNLNYPSVAKSVGAEGLVSVQFVIEKDGTVQEAKILKPLGFGIDEEAIRVIKLLKFSPGKQRGVPVRVQMTVPIKFQLK